MMMRRRTRASGRRRGSSHVPWSLTTMPMPLLLLMLFSSSFSNPWTSTTTAIVAVRAWVVFAPAVLVRPPPRTATSSSSRTRMRAMVDNENRNLTRQRELYYALTTCMTTYYGAEIAEETLVRNYVDDLISARKEKNETLIKGDEEYESPLGLHQEYNELWEMMAKEYDRQMAVAALSPNVTSTMMLAMEEKENDNDPHSREEIITPCVIYAYQFLGRRVTEETMARNLVMGAIYGLKKREERVTKTGSREDYKFLLDLYPEFDELWEEAQKGFDKQMMTMVEHVINLLRKTYSVGLVIISAGLVTISLKTIISLLWKLPKIFIKKIFRL